MTESAPRVLALLPSVEKLLACEEARRFVQRYPRAVVVDAARFEIERVRDAIRRGAPLAGDAHAPTAILERVGARLEREQQPRLRRVVNATGIVVHTNLGRASLSTSAARRAYDAAIAPCTLEYDLETGGRGHRDDLVEGHLIALTGAEAATVVNNNAAAVLLLLNTLAEGREVVVSRGELVEIGGSFRIPEIMKKGGAILREVGTTNRTHAADYERAIGADTAVLLKVHTSNFRIVGFTATVGLEELRRLADERSSGLVVAEDLGSGAMVDLRAYRLGHEPLVSERLASGADVVTFSGDKLLGGPQCGVIAGKRAIVERLRKNPLARALRCDKMTLAALEETLRAYRFDPDAIARLPVLAALARPVEELEALGQCARELVSRALGERFDVAVVVTAAKVGAGAQPDFDIESRALSVRSPEVRSDAIAKLFRDADPPIVGRIENDAFLLDLRTVTDPSDLVPKPPRA